MKIPDESDDMVSLPHLIMPVHQMKQLEPLTESLRNIVTSCYKYHGQEHLLKGDPHLKASPPEGATVDIVNMDSSAFVTGALLHTNKSAGLEPRTGVLRPMQLFKNQGSPNVAVKSTSHVTRRANEKTFVEIFICFFCEKEFQDKPQLQKHQQECSLRPSGIQLRSPAKVGKPYVPPVVIPRKRPPLKDYPYVRPKFSRYMEGLGLLPKSRAVAMRRNTSVECDVIDLTTEEAPRVPITPKSPRTLISQLSRDMSPTGGTSRLSFTLEPQVSKIHESSEDSDAESEQNNSSKVTGKLKIGKVASLLQIDLCSPLGQRLQKHIVIDKPDKHENGEDEHYEHFCRTPKKNESMARLRNRKDMFPNTFRRKRTRDFFYHMYKFNKRQKQEFVIKMKTGLTTRSRRLAKSLKTCKVLLPKLTETEIEELSKPRPYGFEWARLNGNVKRPGYYHQGRYVVNNAEELKRFLISNPSGHGLTLNKLLLNHQQNRPVTLYGKMPGQTQLVSSELLRQLVSNNPMLMPQHINQFAYQQPLQQPGPSSSKVSPFIVPGQGQYTLTAQDLFRGTKRRRDDDVISISSNDSDGEGSGDMHKKSHSRGGNKPPLKRAKVENEKPTGAKSSAKSQTVLFKCHLCAAEILFSLETTEFIRRHFADKHGVRNIRIMEQKDSTGQLVLSIVEDPPSRPNFNQSNNKTNLQNKAPSSLGKQGEGLKSKDARSKPSSKVPVEDVICIDD